MIEWVEADGTRSCVSGASVDASVYGLGVVVPTHIPVDTEVTVFLHGVAICGGAKVRHSQTCPSGFNTGLEFNQALFMQKIPGLDKVLSGSFYTATHATKPPLGSLIQRLRLRVGRALRLTVDEERV